jgi:hypothetical protein
VRLAFAAIVVGVLAGLIGRGSPTRLLRLRFRWTALLAVFLLASLAARLDAPGAFAALLAGTAAFAVFAFANALPVRGMLLVGIGFTLNLVVMADNHGMPYRPDAVVSAGAFSSRSADLVPRSTVSSHPERASDQLMLLADVIPLRPLREVVSLGDVLVAIGLGLVVFHGLLGDGLRRARHRAVGDAAISIPDVPGPVQDPSQYTAQDPAQDPASVWAPPAAEPVTAAASEVEVAPSVLDQQVRLLRATGDVSVILDLVDVPGDDLGDGPDAVTARVAVTRALRGLPLPGDDTAATGAVAT